MYDNENPNGFGSNPEGNNDDNISGTENNNFEEVNSQQVSQGPPRIELGSKV